MAENNDCSTSSALSASEQVQPSETIQLNGWEITLLGTAHVSKASADAAEQLIRTGDFTHVAVELCETRYTAITNPDAIASMDLFSVIKNKRVTMVAASLALGAYQQRLAEQFGIQPGAEMRVAINTANELGQEIVLIDRDVGITLKRVYRNIPWWRKIYVMSGLAASLFFNEKVSEEEIEHLKEGDVLETTFSQFADKAKDLYIPLIRERDEYMAAKIRAVIEKNGSDKGALLAVIGAGHLKGIAEIMRNSSAAPDEVIQRLQTIPPARSWLKIIPWLIVVLVLSGFAYGFSKSTELGWNLVTQWVVLNGGLSALGAALAGGHVLTVLTAFIAAPITSLNPTVGAGMVTAAAEVYFRKPKVKDFENLRTDTTHFSGWRSNRVARTILVFLLSTLGSVIGTYVAGFQIFDALTSIN